MQSLKSSTIQTKLNNDKNAILAALKRKNIKFACDQFVCESEDGKEEAFGFTFVTELFTCVIVPDYVKRKVGFLIYNHRMVEHLESEGFSPEEVENKGKVWLFVENRAKFIKILGG